MPAGITMSRNSAYGQRRHHEASRYNGENHSHCLDSSLVFQTMYLKRSFSLLHWPCSVVPGAQTSSYCEMRICTGASQHATGTVSWQNVRTCLERLKILEDVLGLVIYDVSRSAEVAEAMFWLTGWRMSTRCAEQWAENVRCNWPLAAAPKRPRSGYHQASHAHQSPSIIINPHHILRHMGSDWQTLFILILACLDP